MEDEMDRSLQPPSPVSRVSPRFGGFPSSRRRLKMVFLWTRNDENVGINVEERVSSKFLQLLKVIEGEGFIFCFFFFFFIGEREWIINCDVRAWGTGGIPWMTLWRRDSKFYRCLRDSPCDLFRRLSILQSTSCQLEEAEERNKKGCTIHFQRSKSILQTRSSIGLDKLASVEQLLSVSKLISEQQKIVTRACNMRRKWEEKRNEDTFLIPILLIIAIFLTNFLHFEHRVIDNRMKKIFKIIIINIRNLKTSQYDPFLPVNL